MSTTAAVPVAGARADPEVLPPQECLTCRIIGTGALAGTGIYALNQSRAHAPGSLFGKRIMAGVGVCKYPLHRSRELPHFPWPRS